MSIEEIKYPRVEETNASLDHHSLKTEKLHALQYVACCALKPSTRKGEGKGLFVGVTIRTR